MQIRDALWSYLDDYHDRIERLSFDDLKNSQPGHFVGLAGGAAGIAYAHWHVANVLGEARWLEGALRWSRLAWAGRLDECAFRRSRRDFTYSLPSNAFLFGITGLHFVRVLVAQTRGETRGMDDALDAFVSCCRQSSKFFELYYGIAGLLQATVFLLRATGSERLAVLGRQLASHLAGQLAHSDRGSVPRGRHSGLGLAHGPAGMLYALLSWSRVTGSIVPATLDAHVGTLLDVSLREPEQFCPRRHLGASMCNGFSGLAILALEAHATLGGSKYYVDAASRAVERALEAPPPQPELCCGRAGVAAACLALSAVDPRGEWWRRAAELVLSALLWDPDEWLMGGLYRGEAVLPCLAADLLAGTRGGLPALAWPLHTKSATHPSFPRLDTC